MPGPFIDVGSTGRRVDRCRAEHFQAVEDRAQVLNAAAGQLLKRARKIKDWAGRVVRQRHRHDRWRKRRELVDERSEGKHERFRILTTRLKGRPGRRPIG
jgi:hypothetical protein